MICKKCGNPLSGKQTSYCSFKCSKLHLKSLYRKRNREKIREYHRRFKMLGEHKPLSGLETKEIIKERGGKCERCNSTNKLNVHHIKPLRFGGSNKTRNLMILCFPCHMMWHQMLTAKFWEPQSPTPTDTAIY